MKGKRNKMTRFQNETRVIAFAAMALLTFSAHAEDDVARTAKHQLGLSAFFDASLSAGSNQPCAMCHAAAAGWTGPDPTINAAGAVYEGSVIGLFGNRKPPSLAYAAAIPTLHVVEEEGEMLFVGGAFWNGRATGHGLGSPIADQAQGPFINPVEQAMPAAACIVYHVCNPDDPDLYPVGMKEVWGDDVCAITWPKDIDDRCHAGTEPTAVSTIDQGKIKDAYDKLALAIAAFEASPEVNPYSSKFDAYQDGKVDLTDEEALGLKVFEKKGECAACHPLEKGPAGERPLFTDFTYDNLGVPRNPDNPWYGMPAEINPDGAAWVDRGLSETLRDSPVYAEFANANDGKQKVPTLRNVDKRPSQQFVKAYMHNGYFKTLEGVVNFYNTRDVKPRCADPLMREADALLQGCWPAPEIAANVNTEELGNLKLTAVEEAALVAFMKTLSDGYVVR